MVRESRRRVGNNVLCVSLGSWAITTGRAWTALALFLASWHVRVPCVGPELAHPHRRRVGFIGRGREAPHPVVEVRVNGGGGGDEAPHGRHERDDPEGGDSGEERGLERGHGERIGGPGGGLDHRGIGLGDWARDIHHGDAVLLPLLLGGEPRRSKVDCGCEHRDSERDAQESPGSVPTGEREREGEGERGREGEGGKGEGVRGVFVRLAR